MFGSKGEKLPGPREIPGPAKEVLTSTFKLDPDAVQFLKAVIRKKQNGQEKVMNDLHDLTIVLSLGYVEIFHERCTDSYKLF